MKVVPQADDGRKAIECYRQHRPDVTLMDSAMPEMDGVAATTAIRSEWPDAKLLKLTTYQGDALALNALKAGASGYLLKSMVRTQLLEAIREVQAGRCYIARQVAAGLATHVTDDGLSPRELEVRRRPDARGCRMRLGTGQLLEWVRACVIPGRPRS